MALANSSGVVQTSYSFEPYGNTSVSGAASDNPYQYTGRENDGAGLYYYRNRYLRAPMGRFVSEDPLGFAAGQNHYLYALGNPLRWRDPLGLDVTVYLYPGVGGNPFGHIGIGVNGDPIVGFDPAPTAGFSTYFGRDVPGEMDSIPASRAPKDSVTIYTTPEQDQAIRQYLARRNPGKYNELANNCAQTVHNARLAGNINSLDTPFPQAILNSLKAIANP